jgi:hypothetical protein
MVAIRQEDVGVFLMALGEGLRNVHLVAKANLRVVMEQILLGEVEGIREVLAIRPCLVPLAVDRPESPRLVGQSFDQSFLPCRTALPHPFLSLAMVNRLATTSFATNIPASPIFL